MFQDIAYRIQNLRQEIKNIESVYYHKLDVWDKGYTSGRQMQLESELRFLEGLLRVSEAA
jgi:hypothetical protein